MGFMLGLVVNVIGRVHSTQSFKQNLDFYFGSPTISLQSQTTPFTPSNVAHYKFDIPSPTLNCGTWMPDNFFGRHGLGSRTYFRALGFWHSKLQVFNSTPRLSLKSNVSKWKLNFTLFFSISKLLIENFSKIQAR